MQYFLLQQAFLDANLELLRAPKSIAHRREANIESQTHHELAVRHITASLHNILWLDFKGSRIVNLLEITRKVALMIILPLDQARDLIGKLGVTNVAASLVHRALVAAL